MQLCIDSRADTIEFKVNITGAYNCCKRSAAFFFTKGDRAPEVCDSFGGAHHFSSDCYLELRRFKGTLYYRIKVRSCKVIARINHYHPFFKLAAGNGVTLKT